MHTNTNYTHDILNSYTDNTAAPDALYKNHTCNYLYKTII